MDTTTSRLNHALTAALLRILRALARVLLRHGLPFQTFAELAKRAYVEVALAEFGIPGRKPSLSRAALLTGLTRKDVQRLADAPQGAEADGMEAANRSARVISGWVRDAQFSDAAGQPVALPVDDAPASFAELVRRYSGDVPTRAVLDELQRVGAVERLPDGRVRLVSRTYIPRASDLAKLAILGTDVAWLVDTIDHNLVAGDPSAGLGPPRFQRKVVYDNLPVEALDALHAVTDAQGQALIERLDQWLAAHDRDANPAVRGTGRARAGLGIYYFEERLEHDEGDAR
jgi:hypothetical protein